jgi:hypothetical protein
MIQKAFIRIKIGFIQSEANEKKDISSYLLRFEAFRFCDNIDFYS